MSRVSRLFNQFQPEHYDLTLQFDRANTSFSGVVKIKGRKVGRPSKRLVLHAKDLKVSGAKLTRLGKDKPETKLARINLQKSFDEVRLHAVATLFPGEYEVELKFSGHITEQMHGIYPCNYKHKGQSKSLIASQFESHHAREAFPCIDEPEAKATFDLSLITPKGEVVLANTPIKKQTVKGDVTQTSFETSPKMSTYLLAFVFGEMHAVTGQTKGGIKVSSWATVAQPKSHLIYANKEAINMLDFFIDYFKTPFPLPKLDQVALPDFDALAMENWGLITFREVGLLADPVNRSLSGEQLTSLVIAHEVSHQWFGNLVTMRWWDDLWLNESFASLMENLAPDRLHPDWQQMEDFVTGRVLSSSNRDIYKDVQSVGVSVKHPDEISTLFDPAIVYAKGARLLSMLYDYIGEEAFRRGLQQYFKQHAYGNTTRDDLWRALSAASGTNIDKLMTPWISQSGQPEVSVKPTTDGLQLSQQRFLLDSEDKQSLWPIPLLTDQPLDTKLLDRREADIKTKIRPIFNFNGSGHYIVNYLDKSYRDDLTNKIIKRQVSSISRINLINDMMLLARAGEYQLVPMLDLVKGCAREPREAVWTMLSRVVGQAQVLVDGLKPTEEHLKVFKRRLADHWYKKLGWQDKPSDDPNTKHLRTTALALSVAGENKDAIKTALNKFKAAKSAANLPAEQRAVIAGAAVRFGKDLAVKQLMKEYEDTANPDVKESICAALCSTRNPAVAKKILAWGLAPGGVVRQQDIDHWFAYLMRNHYARELAWQWLTDNWDYLIKLFGGSKHMEYFVWYSAGPLSTVEWQKRFMKFFKPKLNRPSMKRNILIALSEIEARVGWRKREEAALKKYFAGQA